MIQYKENKFCPSKEYYIDYLTIKNLSRVLKNRKLFTKFRCTIGINKISPMSNAYAILFSWLQKEVYYRNDNPFIHCKSFKDILKILKDVAVGEVDLNNEESIQIRITNSTNFLLHMLLEKNLGDLKTIEKIGEETFNMTCEELFGKGFKDLTVPEGIDMDLILKYNKMISSGETPEITPDIKAQLDKFTSFIKEHGMFYNSPIFPDNDEDDTGFVWDDDEFFEEDENESVPF